MWKVWDLEVQLCIPAWLRAPVSNCNKLSPPPTTRTDASPVLARAPLLLPFVLTNILHKDSDSVQCVTVPKMLNDTDTDTFFRYQILSIPIPVLFSGTKFFRYRFRDFFRDSILPIPVPRLFSGTKFFQYRFRYHQKYEKFPVPVPFWFRYPL